MLIDTEGTLRTRCQTIFDAISPPGCITIDCSGLLTLGTRRTATVVFLAGPYKCLRDATFTLKYVAPALTAFLKVTPGMTVAFDALAIYTALVIRAAFAVTAELVGVTANAIATGITATTAAATVLSGTTANVIAAGITATTAAATVLSGTTANVIAAGITATTAAATVLSGTTANPIAAGMTATTAAATVLSGIATGVITTELGRGTIPYAGATYTIVAWIITAALAVPTFCA